MTTTGERTGPAASGALGALETEVRRAIPASVARHRSASEVVPGGASRSRFWWPVPLYVERAEGPYVTDVDDRRYVDCTMGFGPMILGYRHPAVNRALAAQLERGLCFGAPGTGEEELARILVEHVPGAERAVFVNSGTEATMTAVRMARAATGRELVAKCEGGWHGHQDSLFHSFGAVAGAPDRAVSVPGMPGIPHGVTDATVVLPFNDDRAFERIDRDGQRLACVVVEAVQGAAGVIAADPGFLVGLRQRCERYGIVLVVDEVITGFRLGAGGACGHYGLVPDLVTLGKVIGGGLPVGAVVGRTDLVDQASGSGPGSIVAAGTFAANPATVAAGLAQLGALVGDPDAYALLDRLGDRMRAGIGHAAREAGVAAAVTGLGSMWGVHFTDRAPRSVRGEGVAPHPAAGRWLAACLLLDGVLVSSPMHLGFLSTAHREADVDAVVGAHARAFARMRADGVL